MSAVYDPQPAASALQPGHHHHHQPAPAALAPASAAGIAGTAAYPGPGPAPVLIDQPAASGYYPSERKPVDVDKATMGGSLGGPAADYPAQYEVPDDELWYGGMVNYYYDPYTGWYRYREYQEKRTFMDRWIGCTDLARPGIWRATAAECFGTMLWVLFLCLGSTATQATAVGWPIPPGAVFSIIMLFILPVILLSTAVASGAHLNPAVTFATFFSGFTKFTRLVLYVCAQLVGGIMGSAIAFGLMTTQQRSLYGAGNCQRGLLSESQAFLSECIFQFAYLWIVFGTALDHTQRRIYGPVVVPFFIAFNIAVWTLISSLIGGASGTWHNAARCFGAGAVSGDFTNVGLSFAGMTVASIIMGLYYVIVPFNHEIRHRQLKTKRPAKV